MVLMDRDLIILKEIGRWRCVLGRHIKELAGFSTSRACDRRLKILLDNDYIKRQKHLYGIPYIYTLTHKSKMLLGLNKRANKIRVDKVLHDVYVLDTVIFYIKHGYKLDNFISEKELHIKSGFGTRLHQPDFVITWGDEKYAVELELNPKAKATLEKNVKDNYLTYDKQLWVTNHGKVFAMIGELKSTYSNVEVTRLEEVLKHGDN